ncbi:luciferin sulfotransferase-like [Phymastichus coffea]|uniref:luciferin sulfotransferase-like n=1 Tax=Phymastichus coffea TaxID=108790 RepID=UPI00273B49B7|nr:luciferin sulfotransferase-like [Phymastichus coffea]
MESESNEKSSKSSASNRNIIYRDCVVNSDGIWVCTFPKASTTWKQDMIWNIVNDLDFKKKTLRFIKTHLPFQLLSRQLREGKRKCKMIYVSKNVNDTCISYYQFAKLMSEDFNIPCEDYCESFLENKRYLLIIQLELLNDLQSVIKKVTIFLGNTLSDEQVEPLASHLSFSNVKGNSAVNYELHTAKVQSGNEKLGRGSAVSGKFMRSGEVGQWKTAMTEE